MSPGIKKHKKKKETEIVVPFWNVNIGKAGDKRISLKLAQAIWDSG